jgi:MJ1316 RNA cyclic group end recognition domain
MQPLQGVFHRIRWGGEFGKAFAIGYWDRIAREERVVVFSAVSFDPEHPDTFSRTGRRWRRVAHSVSSGPDGLQDGVVVWQRKAGATPDGR